MCGNNFTSVDFVDAAFNDGGGTPTVATEGGSRSTTTVPALATGWSALPVRLSGQPFRHGLAPEPWTRFATRSPMGRFPDTRDLRPLPHEPVDPNESDAAVRSSAAVRPAAWL